MIITIDKEKVRLPDFFVVGAAKGATTTINSLLKQHPGIFLPERKELYFFCYNGEMPRFKLADGTFRKEVGCTREEYVEMYKKAPADCLAGDTSSWYLYYHDAVIRNMQALYGERMRDLKIIMVLRNPIGRAWSHYSMHLGHGLIDIPFREAVAPGEFREKLAGDEGFYPGYDYIGFGMYSRQVEAYLDAFNNVKIILYEDFGKDTDGVMKEIFSFLGLESGVMLQAGKRLNVSGAPKSPLARLISRIVYRPYGLKRLFVPLIPEGLRYKIKTGLSRFLFKRTTMSTDDRSLLIDIYRDDILHLEKLIHRDLSHWIRL
jgi:hypothetical protein